MPGFCSSLRTAQLEGVRHDYIKLSNIIHRGENVYFTDFSSSIWFGVSQETSTESPATATILYAAPESFQAGDGSPQRHGTKTDVYSLGMVYVEMLTVLHGSTIDDLREYVNGVNGSVEGSRTKQYHRVAEYFEEWFVPRSGVTMYLTCIQPMPRAEQDDRPQKEC
ncbi:hypothetical protein K469DRAFT_804743 [Zopfia rhizophila CBS 207.26]|uniref:Protein kinase domain-containing protein n=1 Tax=Zopfia rhizophila CBS 207.26 TaxID=1314779 RepID=A0A6A6EM05_9PEZI|nr:hypothetical protein K469DRAFT_804743 [Zopfia rhizophila CBS 207.26]